jgi:stage V sporulation protein S
VAAEVEVFKVGKDTKPVALAGAIANVIRKAHELELQCVGAGATQQAVKSVAVARGYLVAEGVDLAVRPSFRELELEGNTRTAMVLGLVVSRRA